MHTGTIIMFSVLVSIINFDRSKVSLISQRIKVRWHGTFLTKGRADIIFIPFSSNHLVSQN
jgi:hypothetical protein